MNAVASIIATLAPEDAAILGTLTPEQAAAFGRAILAADAARGSLDADETDTFILATIGALPAEAGSVVATIGSHMLGFDRDAARAAADAAMLADHDGQTADAADAWLRETHDDAATQDDNETCDDATQAAPVDYATCDVGTLIDAAERDGAVFELRDDAQDGISVTGTSASGAHGDVTFALIVCFRLAEIRDELYRRAGESADATDAADAIVRDAAETAAALAAADAIIGHDADACVTLDALSPSELLDCAAERGVTAYMFGTLVMVQTPDGQPSPLSDAIYRRSAELRAEVERRSLTADEQARLRAWRDRAATEG